MRYVNIVHLSDLHLTVDETGRYNQSLILDGLTEDLGHIKDTQLRPDCIVFSGDIVQNADDKEIFDEAALILSELAKVSGLDDSRVFLCPGNHDASRTSIGPNIPTLKSLRDKASSPDGLNRLASDLKMLSQIGGSFRDYLKFQSQFGMSFSTYSDALVEQYFIRDLRLALISINTAALTGAGLTDDIRDERRLIFPEMSLAKAIKRVPDGAQLVVIGHHPLSFLSETTENLLSPLFYKSVDLYMSGHLHAARPHTVIAPQGRCTFAQSGSLYASREWWNGYSIISLVPGEAHQRITYRKWHEQRRKFGVASDLDDEGVIYSSPESKVFWSTVTPKMDFRLLEKWRSQTLVPYLAEDFGTDFAEICDQHLFVEPKFERDNYVETENGLEKTTRPETISFAAIVAQHDNVVIAAGSESGKTTLIRHWAYQMANIPVATLGWAAPVIFRFGEIRNYVKSIENLVRRRLNGLPDTIDPLGLLENGMVTVFIDEMDLKTSDVKTALDAFVLKYPNCRYVLLTGSVYLQGAGIAPVVVPGIPFSHLRLKQLKTSQLLTLIESHGTTDPAQADRLLQRMVQEASSLNVPITPVTGTFLIQIYTEDASQPLINRANLVERYVEISLEKFAPQELLPSSFDFHNKSDLLSFIAERMCTTSSYEIAEAEFINLITEYMNEFGLRFSAIDLLQYFVKARVLNRSAGFISFRLNAFMEYFAALRMTTQPNFREYILDDQRYLSFCNEITFYAAISRKDRTWLEELHQRFKATASSVWGATPPEVQDGSLIETFQMPMPTAKEADVLDVERRIFEEPLEESERRLLLDGEDVVSQRPMGPSDRRLATDPAERWTAQLTLLSAMLKNMELVPSVLKKQILSDVILGWLQFLSLSMGIVPALAKDKRLKFAGIEYIVLFPENMEIGEVARRLFMYMPISTAKIATHHLGTEKLRVQLEEGIGASQKQMPASQQFLRATILAQLGVEGLSEIIEKASGAFEDKGYLSSVFVRMLSEIVVRFRLPEGELRDIRRIAADTIARIEGKTGRGAAVRKGQVIEALSANRLKLQILDGSRGKQ